MSRKDTILIAVIINAGLLAILFATAVIYDTDRLIDHSELDTSLAEAPPIQSETYRDYNASKNTAFDEIDQELKNYVEPSITLEKEELFFSDAPVLVETSTSVQNNDKKVIENEFIEITVKKGDSLDKIAKANRTTVEAIKNANRLNSERLSIGQHLKIPAKKEPIIPVTTPAPVVQKQPVISSTSSSEATYHVVKSGDSPWKIAKQYGVNYEQILKLNHLDEDKARNLKIGDRIRVK